MAEKEKKSYIGLIEFLCDTLDSVSGRDQSFRVVVFLTDGQGVEEKLFDLLDVQIIHGVMFYIDDERDTFELVVQDLFTEVEEVAGDFRKIIRFDASSQFQNKEEVCLMNQLL